MCIWIIQDPGPDPGLALWARHLPIQSIVHDRPGWIRQLYLAFAFCLPLPTVFGVNGTFGLTPTFSWLVCL
jgi:hypothetical protein